ncbi:hypothetical protein ACFV83_36900, partial [Streptomyces pharetrae]
VPGRVALIACESGGDLRFGDALGLAAEASRVLRRGPEGVRDGGGYGTAGVLGGSYERHERHPAGRP